MALDDLKGDWQAQQDAELVRLSPDEILSYVASRSKKLDRQLRFRDWREYIAAIIALAVIAPGTIHAGPVARVGLAALTGAFLLMAFSLQRARRMPGADQADQSVVMALRNERARVEAQARLLERVLLWYVGPILVSVVVIVAGIAGASLFTVAFTIVTAMLGFVIHRLNAHAVRKDLRPRLAELTRLLDEVGDTESTGG